MGSGDLRALGKQGGNMLGISFSSRLSVWTPVSFSSLDWLCFCVHTAEGERPTVKSSHILTSSNWGRLTTTSEFKHNRSISFIYHGIHYQSWLRKWWPRGPGPRLVTWVVVPTLGIGIWEVKVWDVTLNCFCKRKITFLFLCFSGFCNVIACLFCTNEKKKNKDVY